jgi:hypothetical protein
MMLAELTVKKLEEMMSRDNLIAYLESLPPETTFNMLDGCKCAYHGLLADALGTKLVSAAIDFVAIDGEEYEIDDWHFAARFQGAAMAIPGSEQMDVVALLELARDMDD